MKIEVRLDFDLSLEDNEVIFCLTKDKSINSLIKSIFNLWEDIDIDIIEDGYYYITGSDSVAVFAIITTIVEEISRIYFRNTNQIENYKNRIELLKQCLD